MEMMAMALAMAIVMVLVIVIIVPEVLIPWIVTLAFPARLGMATDSPPANI
jgi:hypothetical protein